MLKRHILGLVIASIAFSTASPAFAGTAEHKISMDFYHADVVSVLRLLARDMGVNLVVDADVHSAVTMSLHDVPARQAFQIVVAVAGCDYDWHGNLVVVGSKATLARLSDASGHRQVFVGAETTLEIPLEYARADGVAEKLNEIYPKLRVAVRAPNSVVVTGPSDQVQYVRRLIKGP